MENNNTDFGKIFRNSVMQKTSEGFTSAILQIIAKNPVYKMEYSREMSYFRWWQYVFTTLFYISILLILYVIFNTNLLSSVLADDFFVSDILYKISMFTSGIKRAIHLSTLSVVLLLCVPFFLIIEQAYRYFSLRKHV